MPFDVTPELVANYGALTVFFAVGIGILSHWYFFRQPKESQERRSDSKMLFEQVALSRQALETSNEVIRANTNALERSADSNERMVEHMGERMEQVESTVRDLCHILGHNEAT